MDNKMYYIQKEGVHYRGIYWIGDDEQEGRDLVKKLAREDEDNYHKWVLYRYFDNGSDKRICEARKSDFHGVEYLGEDKERVAYLYRVITPLGDELTIGVPCLASAFDNDHVFGLNLNNNEGHVFHNGTIAWRR